ncbi:hypothetical protein GCM10025868_36880 [Angustibacter aerolatus]|uniref:Uncharacterized protein n=1 Tax=Angustibacter aerolatus TaxID=1162965 RepID=A0ABQ6JJR2_9ACTN|nr:hypothetical protein GCM10025868_36880 [Angustibacter aerolatus]
MLFAGLGAVLVGAVLGAPNSVPRAAADGTDEAVVYAPAATTGRRAVVVAGGPAGALLRWDAWTPSPTGAAPAPRLQVLHDGRFEPLPITLGPTDHVGSVPPTGAHVTLTVVHEHTDTTFYDVDLSGEVVAVREIHRPPTGRRFDGTGWWSFDGTQTSLHRTRRRLGARRDGRLPVQRAGCGPSRSAGCASRRRRRHGVRVASPRHRRDVGATGTFGPAVHLRRTGPPVVDRHSGA